MYGMALACESCRDGNGVLPCCAVERNRLRDDFSKGDRLFSLNVRYLHAAAVRHGKCSGVRKTVIERRGKTIVQRSFERESDETYASGTRPKAVKRCIWSRAEHASLSLLEPKLVLSRPFQAKLPSAVSCQRRLRPKGSAYRSSADSGCPYLQWSHPLPAGSARSRRSF